MKKGFFASSLPTYQDRVNASESYNSRVVYRLSTGSMHDDDVIYRICWGATDAARKKHSPYHGCWPHSHSVVCENSKNMKNKYLLDAVNEMGAINRLNKWCIPCLKEHNLFAKQSRRTLESKAFFEMTLMLRRRGTLKLPLDIMKLIYWYLVGPTNPPPLAYEECGGKH